MPTLVIEEMLSEFGASVGEDLPTISKAIEVLENGELESVARNELAELVRIGLVARKEYDEIKRELALVA